jgi:hypothetical protein
MTLRFDPGAYQSAFQYGQNRDDQGRKALADSINAVPQAMVAEKDKARQDQMSQMLMEIKAKEAGLTPNPMAQTSKPSFWDRFSKSVPLTDPTAAPANLPTPVNAFNGFDSPSGQPMIPPQSASAGVSSDAPPVLGSGGSLVDRWKALPQNHAFGPQAQTQPKPNAPTEYFTRPNVDYKSVMGAAKGGDYAPMFNLPPKEQALAMKGYEYDQNREDRASRDNQLTAFQQASLDNQKQNRDFTMGEKQDQFYQKEWDKIDKEANPLTASGRTGLGMAARADYNANRALVTLSKPMVTNQEAANVMADIAQIYQGGSATQYGMSHQGYDSLYQKIAGTMQYLTGKPQDALPPQIQQRLIGVLNDMKATNKAVVKQQLDHIEATQPKVIGKFQNEWKGLRANLEGGIAGGPPENGTAGGGNADPLGLGL